MNGTVPPQLSEFSHQLSELQSLLINQNKVHAALQEVHKGLLLHDHELDYQRKIQSLEQENGRLKEMVEGWKSQCKSWKGKYMKCQEEFKQRLLKLESTYIDIEPTAPSSSALELPVHDSNAKLPVQNGKSTQKSEETSVRQGKWFFNELIGFEGFEQFRPAQIGPSRKRKIVSSDNGNDPGASSSQKLKTPTGPAKQANPPPSTEKSNESAAPVGLSGTPAQKQARPHPKQYARKSTGGNVLYARLSNTAVSVASVGLDGTSVNATRQTRPRPKPKLVAKKSAGPDFGFISVCEELIERD